MEKNNKIIDKIKKSQVETVKKMAARMRKDHPEYRKGQALFNALHIMHPEVAENVRSKSYDPFYKDENIEECIKQITSDE